MKDKLTHAETLPGGKCLTTYIFAFWFATEILLSVNLESVAGISMNLLTQLQAVLTLALLMVQIAWFQNYTKQEFWCIAGISVLLAIAMMTSGIRSLFSTWLFIVASQNTDFDENVRIAYDILLVMLFVVILFYLAGVIPDPLYDRENHLRFSFGFTHPNTFGARLFQLAACRCYLRRSRLRWWDIVLTLALAFFAYSVPNSQAATVGILFIFIVMLGICLRIKIPVWWSVTFAACIPAASIALSWMDVRAYPLLLYIDRMLSSRFASVHTVWQRYGVTLFGHKIYVTPQERALIGLDQSLWLDNAYGYILLRYGMVVFLLFAAVYLYTIYWHGKHSHGVLVGVLLVYALYGVEESYLQMLSYNVFLLAMAPVLYDKRAASDTLPEIYFSLPALVSQIRDRWKERKKAAWFYRVQLLFQLCKCRVRSILPVKVMEKDVVRSYKKHTGRRLDFHTPQSYSQKLCVAKLYNATPEKTRLTDKLQVREWVAQKVGEEYLVPMYGGGYDNFAEIDFDALPQSFVMKCNHDSGSTILVEDKKTLDFRRLKRQYDFYMRRNFAYVSYEMHYRDIKPKILIEKNLSGDGHAIRDYKFICFHGRPYYCWVDVDRFGIHKRITYDMDWTVQPFVQYTYPQAEPGPRPQKFEEMKRIVSILCQGFDQVRVDLYYVQNQIYFGEMTFTDGSGYEAIFPEEWDIVLGELWHLERGTLI